MGKKIRRIEKLDAPEDRLAPYLDLKRALDGFFSAGDRDVMRAIEKPNPEKDGLSARLSSDIVTIGLFGSVILPAVYSISALAPLLPVLLPATVVLMLGTMAASRTLVIEKRARELGMTAEDVKYAQKLKSQQQRVSRAIKVITIEEQTRDRLTNLRETFGDASAARPGRGSSRWERPVARALPRPSPPQPPNN